jgi:hypothetical protein
MEIVNWLPSKPQIAREEKAMMSEQEVEEQQKALRAEIERVLPNFANSCRDDTDEEPPFTVSADHYHYRNGLPVTQSALE